MPSRTVTVRNALGMHARAAARFVHAASAFRCRITVMREDRGDRHVDGKSILGLLLLAAARGVAIRITADGPDEAEAIDALCRLVDGGFGEGHDQDPRALRLARRRLGPGGPHAAAPPGHALRHRVRARRARAWPAGRGSRHQRRAAAGHSCPGAAAGRRRSRQLVRGAAAHAGRPAAGAARPDHRRVGSRERGVGARPRVRRVLRRLRRGGRRLPARAPRRRGGRGRPAPAQPAARGLAGHARARGPGRAGGPRRGRTGAVRRGPARSGADSRPGVRDRKPHAPFGDSRPVAGAAGGGGRGGRHEAHQARDARAGRRGRRRGRDRPVTGRRGRGPGEARSPRRERLGVGRRGCAGPVSTSDGVVVRFLANIERLEEIEGAKAAGAEGIGLFRSEFLLGGRAIEAFDEDAPVPGLPRSGRAHGAAPRHDPHVRHRRVADLRRREKRSRTTRRAPGTRACREARWACGRYA